MHKATLHLFRQNGKNILQLETTAI